MMDTLAIWLGERLLIGSIQGAAIIALVWLTCRLFPRIPAAAQAALWWLAALKLVLAFTPLPAVPVPVLPANFHVQTERIFLQTPSAAAEVGTPLWTWVGEDFTVQGQDDWFAASATSPWFRALLLIWLVALLVQAGRLVLTHRHLRAIVRRSVEWPDAGIGELAQRLGLRRAPQVRLSDEIGSPQVCGVWTPVVLLPTESRTTLSDNERTMTLCHELMHIRRRDLLLGWVPACAERLFFFHPMARLAAREYVTSREAACDAAAMRALDVAADDYGRLLIRLGIATTSPIIAAGGSPFSRSSLKRRLNMLEHHRFSNLPPRWRWAIAVLAAVLIPMQLVARSPEPPSKLEHVLSPQVSGPSFDLYQMLKGVFAKVQGKQNAANQENPQEFFVIGNPRRPVQKRDDGNEKPEEVELRIQVEKIKVDQAKAEIERKLKEKEKEIRLAIESDQGENGEIRLKIAKLMEQAAQERAGAAQEEAIESKRREQLEAELDARARSLERARPVVREREQDDLTQAIRRLSERLEQLAAEQRQLAEEIRRLQSQSPRK